MTQRTNIVLLAVIADSLRECKEAREGTLYAALMGDVSLAEFNRLVDVLVELGIAKRGDGHLLTYTTPAPGTKGARFMAAVASAANGAA